jgi:hypothetical protein
MIPMKRYRIYAVATIGIEIEVEAEDELDAEDKAWEHKMPVLGVNPWAREGHRDAGYWKASSFDIQTDDRYPAKIEAINE